MDAYELFVKGYLRTVIFSDSLKKTDAALMWHGFWYGNRL